jgi:CheY-like chemotaxis protein
MSQSSTTKSIVLYADDDPDDLQLVKEAFCQYSHNVEVVTAADGVEAISYLGSLKPYDPTPCLIILDINMPRMNGKETLMRLRSLPRFEEVPVVLFTTSSMLQDLDFAHHYKAGFVTKPIDMQQMDRVAERFLEHCTEEVRKSMKG